jgi:hypothetical protein
METEDTGSSEMLIPIFATSWKVVGSRPDDVNEFFQFT